MPTPIYQRPAELLQNLIRFNTTNPPGHEVECVRYIKGLLDEAGIESTLIAKDPNRPNLIARIPSRGDAAPLLLYGHVDVVTTESQNWTHPPFEAEIHDGYIWGRGALDMKGPDAMLIAAFLRAHAESANLPGDVILCIVVDEEAGGEFGAEFLIQEHPDLFKGVRYALGEFGGFTLHIGGKHLYTIQVIEKQICSVKATLRGPAGHGSLTHRGRGTATAKLAKMLDILEHKSLPVHITPAARVMFGALADTLGFPSSLLIRQLLNPALTDRILPLMSESASTFDPLLHNTVNATIIQGGDKINVIPSEITVKLDGRLLPGQTPDDMLRELRQLLGPDIEWEVFDFDPGPPEPDMSFFDTLADILKRADPTGTPIPLMLGGVTDARFFSQLGIQSYGFTPMQLPPDFNFPAVIHAADERIPVEAVAWGADRIYEALLRFGEVS